MKTIFTAVAGMCLASALTASAQLQFQGERTFARTLSQSMDHARKTGIKMTKAPVAHSTGVITSPDGEAKEYTKTYSGCYVYDAVYPVYDLEESATIVWNGDNAYISDPITMMPMGSYVRGAVEGDKITVALPQTLYVEEEEYNGVVYTAEYTLDLVHYIDFDGFDYYMPGEGSSEITYTIGQDGTVTLDTLPDGAMLGLVGIEDGEAMWVGFAENAATYTPVGDEDFDPTALPGVEYSYITYGYDTPQTHAPDFGYKVKFADHGNDVYISGFCLDEPRWWFKGHRDGNRITVDNNQKMGTLLGVYTVSLMFGTVDPEATGGYSLLPDDAQFVFEYDTDMNAYVTATPDVVMFVNALPNQIYYLTKIENPTLLYQPEAKGAPCDPWNLVYNARWIDEDGYAVFDVNLPIVSTDGVLLDRANMYYQIYIDGDLETFEDYGLAETTDIPYNHDGREIVSQRLNTNHEMLIFFRGYDKLGIKLFNVCDGITYESNVVEVEVREGEITTGVREITAEEVSTRELYDLSGVRVVNPGKGIYVKKTTMSDGTVITSKVVIR